MDLLHDYGNDLNLSADGDLAVAAGTVEGQQRVLRRLLTNPSDYKWHPIYGAGLARFVGQPAPGPAIAAVASSQMRKEQAVTQNPPPVTTVRQSDDGTLVLDVKYVDAPSLGPVLLSVPVN